ncbi:MAG TPA: sterol desaturase family protein [Candidatus Eisenbacteria bacterium]|nr:sterol desaturase family protein [Candidatus Eisenbacteria bacterium]
MDKLVKEFLLTEQIVEQIKQFLQDFPLVYWFARNFYYNLLALLKFPVNPNHRLYYGYLIAFVVMSAIGYLYFYHTEHGRRFSFRKFLEFCFPKSIYLHPSAVMDYKLFIANHFIGVQAFLAMFSIEIVVIDMVNHQLNQWLGPRTEGLPQTWWTMTILVILVTMVKDFGQFIDHVMEHYIAVLWPIHMVHHSAEVLTPVTTYRTHPLSGAASFPIQVVLNASVQSVLFYLFLGDPALLTIAGYNAVEVFFNVFGSNLRHSHVWFSFGPVLSRVFISPAQHQIHHSVDPKHWNKNFGVTFALWDWMFGTLYIPKEREDLVFGINPNAPQPHPTLFKAYLAPLQEIVLMMSFHRRRLSA